jgi:murein DD-endopeptidase MepM/ murein hydrolase activator NlpD
MLVFCAAPAAQAAAATHHASPPASLQEKIDAQRRQVEAAQKRLHEKRNQLRFRELHSADLQRQLRETNQNINRVTESLDELNAQIRGNERRLWWNSKQLDAAEATLKRHNDALRRRLVDAYERGDVDYIEVLFSSTSFSDFVERWDDIRFLIAANQRTVRERLAAERAVAAAQRRLEVERVELSNNVSRAQRDRAQLAGLADERAQLVQVAEEQRRSTAHEVAELEDLTAAQEAALEKLIVEEQRIEEARREADLRARKLRGEPIPPQLGAPAYLSWPVSGPITSPFGMRPNPFGGGGFEFHTGLDIGAPMGATITAAAGGRVLSAGPYGGYGNLIIIDHGGSMVTLYGHCSQIFVGKGQDVQRGQAIGAVGMTGRATGPHLHFEVRIDGKPVDPSGRLR